MRKYIKITQPLLRTLCPPKGAVAKVVSVHKKGVHISPAYNNTSLILNAEFEYIDEEEYRRTLILSNLGSSV